MYNLGLEVSSSELFDMVQGDNPYPTVKQSFTNPETGQFDRARLLQFLKEDINNDETGQAMQQWLNFEEAIRKERQNNKYNALVAKGLSASDWEAQLTKKYQSEIRNVSYVQIPFQSIPDSLISVTDSDLKSYIKDNSKNISKLHHELLNMLYSMLVRQLKIEMMRKIGYKILNLIFLKQITTTYLLEKILMYLTV